jgi:hypothetical protein
MNKGKHEYRERSKKSKTEVGSTLGDGERKTEDLGYFEFSPTKVGPPTTTNLKQLPKQAFDSTLSAFFKPKIIAG